MQIVMSWLSLATIIGCFMIGEVSAFTHIVGGSHGWRVPDNLTYYEEWAMPRTFGVGDKLGKLFLKKTTTTTLQYNFVGSLFLFFSCISSIKQ